MNKLYGRFIYLLVLALSLSSFRYVCINLANFSILEHNFKPQPLSFLVSTLFFFLLLILLSKLLPKLESHYLNANSTELEKDNFYAFLPFLLGFFSPLLLKYYVTVDDLRSRVMILALLMLLGFLFLKLTLYFRHKRQILPLQKILQGFNQLSLKSRLVILFFAAFCVYMLGSLCLVHQGLSFSGDEPYYLLNSHSLYHDKDINVANNYDNRDYTFFYPKEIYPSVRLGVYARVGKKGVDYRYPVNQPGVSALILPHYWLSHYFSGRTRIYILKCSLAFWGALLGLQLYLLFSELWKKDRLSLGLWAMYAFTSPILFYSIHIYPEIPIACFSLFVYRKAISKPTPTPLQLLFCGFLLSLFPWFGLKYNTIFWPLLLVAGYFLLKEHHLRAKILYFLAFPILLTPLFYLYIHQLYGAFNPIAIYEGMLTPEKLQNFRDVMWRTPITLRIDSFLDYFLDQRDGLLLYSPVYFFFFLGFIEVLRKSKRELLTLLLICAPFIFNYAFFAHRQGSSPPGRVLTSLSWVGFIFIAYFLVYNRKKLYTVLFFIALTVSYVIVALLLANPSYLYQPTTHEFTFRGGALFLHLSNLQFYLPDWLPSFLKINNLRYIPNYVWLGLILVFMGGYAWKRDFKLPRRYSHIALISLLILMVLTAWLSLFPRMVLLFPERASYSSGERVAFYSLGRNARMREPGEFDLIEDNRSYTFNFTSWRALEDLEITFGSLEGKYAVKIWLFDNLLFSGETDQELKTITFAAPPFYSYKNAHLYQMSLELEDLSQISTSEFPYRLSIGPRR